MLTAIVATHAEKPKENHKGDRGLGASGACDSVEFRSGRYRPRMVCRMRKETRLRADANGARDGAISRAAGRGLSMLVKQVLVTRSRILLPVMLVGMLAACGCIQKEEVAALRERNLLADTMRLRARAQYAFDTSRPVTLDYAVGFALENNLQAAMSELEKAIAYERATGEKLKMIPDLKASGSLTRKSHPKATVSENVATGDISEDATFSEEKVGRKWSLGATWNLLDFGLSYLRSRKAANDAIAARQDLRRTRQKLVLDVTQAYWRAAVADLALARSRDILERSQQRQEAVDKQIREKTRGEAEALQYKRSLLQTRLKLDGLKRHAARARAELAELMGLPPGADFTLAPPPIELIPDHWTPGDLAELEMEALLNRPEMTERDMKTRAALHEARMELVRMFPNLNLFARREGEPSKYVHWTAWSTVGIDAAWQLLSIPQQIQSYKRAKLDVELQRRRRLAMTLAVMTQVRLAVYDYEDAYRQMEMQREMAQVQDRLYKIMRTREEQGEVNEEAVFSAEADALLSYARYLDAYSDMMVARERVNSALGRMPAGAQDLDVDVPAPDDSAVESDPSPTPAPAPVITQAKPKTSTNTEAVIPAVRPLYGKRPAPALPSSQAGAGTQAKPTASVQQQPRNPIAEPESPLRLPAPKPVTRIAEASERQSLSRPVARPTGKVIRPVRPVPPRDPQGSEPKSAGTHPLLRKVKPVLRPAATDPSHASDAKPLRDSTVTRHGKPNNTPDRTPRTRKINPLNPVQAATLQQTRTATMKSGIENPGESTPIYARYRPARPLNWAWLPPRDGRGEAVRRVPIPSEHDRLTPPAVPIVFAPIRPESPSKQILAAHSRR